MSLDSARKKRDEAKLWRGSDEMSSDFALEACTEYDRITVATLDALKALVDADVQFPADVSEKVWAALRLAHFEPGSVVTLYGLAEGGTPDDVK